jgi:hypothetical protein
MENQAVDIPIPTATDPESTSIAPEDLVTQLRAYRERIPKYGQLTVAQAKQLRPYARLKPAFLTASFNAIGASSTVVSAVNGETPAVLTQEQVDVVRWRAVEDELKSLLKGVAAANLIRMHRIGLAALQAYGVSQQLVRRPENSDLLPHVQEMKRLSKPRKKAATTQPPPDPQPAPAPTTAVPADSHPALSKA